LITCDLGHTLDGISQLTKTKQAYVVALDGSETHQGHQIPDKLTGKPSCLVVHRFMFISELCSTDLTVTTK